MMPDEPSREEQQQQLPQDNDTPFQPSSFVQDDTVPLDNQTAQSEANTIADDHPSTDTNLQPEEIYDEGYAGAAEANEPNAGNTVTGYSPEKDQRTANNGEDTGTPDESIGSPS